MVKKMCALKKFSFLVLVLALCLTAANANSMILTAAQENVYIRSDGSINPSMAPIQRVGNAYTLTANIYASIVVERDNIVVDGTGFTIQGKEAFTSTGVALVGRTNVTLKNTKITAFYYGIRLYESSNISVHENTLTNNEKCGIYLHSSSDNTVSRNHVTNNGYGIRLYSSAHNTITGNNVTDNEWSGIELWHSPRNNISRNHVTNNYYGVYSHFSTDNTVFGNTITANKRIGTYFFRSLNNSIYLNEFVDNPQQATSPSSINVWDDGAGKGNYWSDYKDSYPNAKEKDESGIYNTPYVIDDNNRDRYPLMNAMTFEATTLFWTQWWFWTIVAAGIIVSVGAGYFVRKRKPRIYRNS